MWPELLEALLPAIEEIPSTMNKRTSLTETVEEASDQSPMQRGHWRPKEVLNNATV